MRQRTFWHWGITAIAYPHAFIVYHGTRRPSVAPLTVEGASSLASSLQQTNEFFAIRLAKCAFDRFVLRLLLLSTEFQQYISSAPSPSQSPDVKPLTQALAGKLAADKLSLLNMAVERQEAIDALTQSVRQHLAKLPNAGQLKTNEFELEILRAILDYKASVHATEDWRLSAAGLTELTADFQLLHDFHFGRQTQALDRLVHVYGKIFLIEEELKQYEALPAADDKGRLTFLNQHAQPRIRPLWYFMVSLCRLLQSADYWFDPEEAYWLGLVDEVPGSNLPNQREFVEGQVTPQPPNESKA